MSSNASPVAPQKSDRSSLFAIFLTVFLDLLSFGIFIPDIQLRGKELAQTSLGTTNPERIGLFVGLVLAIYSIAQLVTAPYLGRLSDRIGRRRVLLVCTLIAITSYVMYAHATTLPMILASRILQGVAAASVGVAFAYVADITTPENRARGLGMIGAAFGLGFILGPPIGAGLLAAGQSEPLLLGYCGAGLALINLIYIWRFVPESNQQRATATGNFVVNLSRAFRSPGLGLLLGMFFVINFGFTNLETTFFQLLADSRSIFRLGDDAARTAGAIVLLCVGVTTALVQAVLLPRIGPRFGEVRLLRFAYLLIAPGLLLVPFMPLWGPALLVIVVLGIGTGLAQPNISSLISRSSPSDMQGSIFGITQSLGALARCISPLISNYLFGVDPTYPYILGASLVVLPAIAAWWLKQPPKAESDVRIATGH